MDFIADNTFHIEASETYTKLGVGLKSVEFVRAKDGKLLFVEAKSSFPDPNNQAPNPNKSDKTGAELFCEAVADICDKFTHSLNLYSAIAIAATEDRFPSDYHPPDKVSLVFVLVINGFEKARCSRIRKALANRISQSICMAKIWKPEICVINDISAASRSIIVGRGGKDDACNSS
jgi:hypothetical protein